MPYPGIKPNSEAEGKMESCISDLMSDKKMQTKYPNRKERKSHSIAICHNSIMGSKKSKYKSNLNPLDNFISNGLKGGEKMIKKTVSTTEIVSDEELENQAEKATADAKAAYKDCVKGNMADGMSMAEASKECKTAMNGKKAEDSVPLDEPAADAPVATEVVEEVVPEVTTSNVATEEEGAVEEVPAVTEEVVATEVAPAEEVVPAETPAEEVAQSDKVTDLVKQVLDKIQTLEATLKKQDEPANGDSASTEGAAPSTESAEVAPEEPAADAVVEDVAPVAPVEAPASEATPTEGASPEGAEDVAKVYAIVSKVPGQLEKLEKAFSERFGTLETRINKIEEQPAPSKVVSPQVVTKSGNAVSPNQERLDVISKELAQLEEMKKTDLDGFQKGRKWEKALDLIAERDQLNQA